jgi:hypothetical protein
MDSNGPIQRYRQLFSWATIGPFKAIDNNSHWQQWAHSRLSAAFLMGNNGPILGYRQFYSWVAMGPFRAIDSISHEQQWAHPM